MRLYPLFIALIAFSGCSILPRPVEKTYYVISQPECTPKLRENAPSLLIRPVVASRLIDGQRILFSRSPQTRGQYQRALWAESPAHQLTELIHRSLECKGPFKEISPGLEPAFTDYTLAVELIELFHDASSDPGTVTVEVRATLYRRIDRSVEKSAIFKVNKPATSYDAAGAVDGMNSAVQEIMTQMIGWIDLVVAPASPTPLQ